MKQIKSLRVNKMISLYLLLWFLLLKSGRTANSLDDDSCSIRFYSIQYFKGNSWTLTSGSDWKYNTDTPFNHPIGRFLPKSIRTFGNTNKCKEGWRVCPYGALMKRKTTKCRKLRHGEVITSINRWGWNNNFLGLVRKIGRTIKTTTSEPTPYPSLPLKVPKDISITRNAQNTESISVGAQDVVERNKHKEQNRSSSRVNGFEEESKGTINIHPSISVLPENSSNTTSNNVKVDKENMETKQLNQTFNEQTSLNPTQKETSNNISIKKNEIISDFRVIEVNNYKTKNISEYSDNDKTNKTYDAPTNNVLANKTTAVKVDNTSSNGKTLKNVTFISSEISSTSSEKTNGGSVNRYENDEINTSTSEPNKISPTLPHDNDEVGSGITSFATTSKNLVMVNSMDNVFETHKDQRNQHTNNLSSKEEKVNESISVLDVVESTSINSNTILHPNISFIKSTKFDGVNYLNSSSKTKKDSNLEDINLGVVPRTINDTYEDYVRKQEQSTSPQTKVKKEPKSLKEPIILHRSNSNSVVQNSEANQEDVNNVTMKSDGIDISFINSKEGEDEEHGNSLHEYFSNAEENKNSAISDDTPTSLPSSPPTKTNLLSPSKSNTQAGLINYFPCLCTYY